MDFATLLVLGQRESLEGKSVACCEPSFFLLFFFLLWPADGSGRVGMADKVLCRPNPQLPTSLSLRQPKSLKFALFELLKESPHSLHSRVSRHISREPCSLLVIPSSSPYSYTHGVCERERVRALTLAGRLSPIHRISCAFSAASSRVHSSGRNELRTRLSGIRPR